MERKKLLYISPRFLFPADCGGKIRPRDILRGLKGGKFEVTLVSPATSGGAQRFAGEIQSVCDHFVSWPETNRSTFWGIRRGVSLLSSVPVAVASDRSAAGRRTVLAQLERDPDVVVADFAHSAILLPQRVACPSVLLTHNLEAEIFRRQAAVAQDLLHRVIWKNQAKKMQRFEEAAARRFDAVVAVSERDASHFRAICGQDRVLVIPTGVDLGYFQHQSMRTEASPDGGTVVFTGSMNWLPNIEGVRYFMDEVWPRIIRARPKANMVVVGHSPPKNLVQAARDRGLPWTFTGFVDDVRPYVNAAHVYVIPLRVGGGTRIKAYEAMAMGCPVVSTAIGVEGLPLVSGRDCLIADTAEAFAASALRILEDAAVRRHIAENARRLVEQNFSAKAAAGVFEDACWRAIAWAQSRRPRAAVPDVLAGADGSGA